MGLYDLIREAHLKFLLIEGKGLGAVLVTLILIVFLLRNRVDAGVVGKCLLLALRLRRNGKD